MAVVRILVDGYSVLHAWPELSPGSARFSAAAREALIQILGQYADAAHLPVTIVFDGAASRGPQKDAASTQQLEIIYSRTGQTADQIIERVTHRMQPFGEVLAVSDDHAERDTVISLGGVAVSTATFKGMLQETLGTLERDLASYNSRERRRYKRR